MTRHAAAQVAQGLGLLIGTVVAVPKTAQTIASIVVLTFVLTGGYFVRGAPPRRRAWLH